MSPDPRYEWRDQPAAREAAPAAAPDDRRVEALQKRVEKLERENRRWGLIAAMVMAGFSLIILLVARATKPADDLRTRRLTLADAEGLPRAVLEVTDGGAPAINFLDRRGRKRLTLGLPDAESPVIEFDGGNEKARLRLALTGETAGALQFLDRDGTERAWVGVDKGGIAGLTVYDPDGRPYAALSGGANGVAGLSFLGRNGKERLGLGINGALSVLRLVGGSSESVAQVTVNAAGLPGLTLTDKERGAQILVAFKPDGTPTITVKEKAGYAAAIGSQHFYLGKDQTVLWQAPQ